MPKVGRPLKDRTGEVHGKLTVVARGPYDGNDVTWVCRCACGNSVTLRSGNIPRTASCGCGTHKAKSKAKSLDLVGRKFGDLTVKERAGSTAAQKALWTVECVCGNETSVVSAHLITGNTRSCGCAKSHIQREIQAFVESLVPGAVPNARGVISKELDIWIPERRLAIELDGLYWHGETMSAKAGKHKLASYHKRKLCEAAGIRLITIFEDEWVSRPEPVKGYLRAILGAKRTVGARWCSVVHGDARKFLDLHHLQGGLFRGETYVTGCGGTVVAATQFSPATPSKKMGLRGEVWELTRYALTPDLSVAGGLSKVMAQFYRDHPGASAVVSYSDNRWSAGGMYAAAGFVKESSGIPTYWYFRPGDQTRRVHRFTWRRDNAVKAYGGVPEDTEWDIMSRNGWDRIWDHGKARWVHYR